VGIFCGYPLGLGPVAIPKHVRPVPSRHVRIGPPRTSPYIPSKIVVHALDKAETHL